MFLKFWIESIIISLILFYGMLKSISHYVETKFTKEELMIIKTFNKRKPNKYPWFIYVFMFSCPVINILYILFVGFNYGDLYNRIIREYNLILKHEKEKGAD